MFRTLARYASRVLAVIAAAFVGGAAAGLASRMLMRAIALMSRSHYGEVTHDGATVGLITLDGTLSLVVEGIMQGVLGALPFVVIGRWIPGRGWRKGLAFGLAVLGIWAPALLDLSNYEYYRYIPGWAALSMFALLFPLYGVVFVSVVEWLGVRIRAPRSRVVARTGYAGLGMLVTWRLAGFLRDLMAARPLG